MTVQLTRFVETYSGSSFPTLSETHDGQSCVVKLRGAGNGAVALLSEFIVNRLCHAIGLPVPNAFVVHVAQDFPWTFGTDEFHDLVRKSVGPNLGLQFLKEAKPVPERRYNDLPHDLITQVVTLDIAFFNTDRTAHSGNLLEDGNRKPWIVDHGSCRFLFRTDATSSPTLPGDHIFAGWEEACDARWLKALNPTLIEQTIAEIPTEWLAEAQLSSGAVARALEACLDRARRPVVVSRHQR